MRPPFWASAAGIPLTTISRARGVVGGGVEARDPVLPVVLVAGGVVDVEPPGVGVVRVDGDAERAALAARDPPRLPVRLVVGFVVDGTHVDGVLGCRDRRERVAVEAPNAADALGEKQRAVGSEGDVPGHFQSREHVLGPHVGVGRVGRRGPVGVVVRPRGCVVCQVVVGAALPGETAGDSSGGDGGGGGEEPAARVVHAA